MQEEVQKHMDITDYEGYVRARIADIKTAKERFMERERSFLEDDPVRYTTAPEDSDSIKQQLFIAREQILHVFDRLLEKAESADPIEAAYIFVRFDKEMRKRMEQIRELDSIEKPMQDFNNLMRLLYIKAAVVGTDDSATEAFWNEHLRKAVLNIGYGGFSERDCQEYLEARRIDYEQVVLGLPDAEPDDDLKKKELDLLNEVKDIFHKISETAFAEVKQALWQLVDFDLNLEKMLPALETEYQGNERVRRFRLINMKQPYFSTRSFWKGYMEKDKIIALLDEIGNCYKSDENWMKKRDMFCCLTAKIVEAISDDPDLAGLNTIKRKIAGYVHDTDHLLSLITWKEAKTVFTAEYTEQADETGEDAFSEHTVKVPGFFESFEEAVQGCKAYRELLQDKELTEFVINKYYYKNEASPYDEKVIYCTLNEEFEASSLGSVCVDGINSDLCSARMYLEDLFEDYFEPVTKED